MGRNLTPKEREKMAKVREEWEEFLLNEKRKKQKLTEEYVKDLTQHDWEILGLMALSCSKDESLRNAGRGDFPNNGIKGTVFDVAIKLVKHLISERSKYMMAFEYELILNALNDYNLNYCNNAPFRKYSQTPNRPLYLIAPQSLISIISNMEEE